MFGLFKKNHQPDLFLSSLRTDIHSHLIPGIDDGVKSLEESIQIARGFKDLGYSRIITTPHIYPGVYDNNPAIIRTGLEKVQEFYKQEGLDIEISAAAEYFVDEHLLESLKSNKELMTFGNDLILLETGFYEPPMIFDEVIFLLRSRQITPVFAHPERYVYIQNKPELAKTYLEKGMLFQLNFLSLSGYYSGKTKNIALDFLKSGHYSLIGSDCHKPLQLELLKAALPKKVIDLLNQYSFMNSGLE